MNSNRKLIVLFNGCYPGGMAMSNRLHLYCKALYKEGVPSHIVSVSDNFNRLMEGNLDGISYAQMPVHIRLSGLTRLFIEPLTRLLIFRRLARSEVKDQNVVLLIGLGWFLNWLLIPIIHSRGAKVILEMNELDYSWRRYKIDPEIIRRFHRFCYLRLTLKKADGVIVISENLYALAVSFRKTGQGVMKIPILCEDTKNNKDSDNFPLPTTNPFIFHAGTLTESKDGITKVFSAYAQALKNLSDGPDFVLTNKKALPETWNEIMSIILENNLKGKVHFMGFLPTEYIEFLRRRCNMAVINKPDTIQNRFNFSTRLAEYLIDGVPVISTPVGEASNYLINDENSLLVTPNDIDEIARAIEYLCKNPDKAAILGRNGQLLAKEQFSYKRYGSKLKQFMHNL